jgi:glycosyltransferase involved in cell wall biosynthesis
LEHSTTTKPLALLTTTAAPGHPTSRLAYADPIEEAGYRVEQRNIREASNLRQFLSTLRIGHRIRRYDLIVANEYSTALALGVLALLYRAPARMVVVTLNLSRRPIRIGFPLLQRFVDRALGRFDAIVVHSSPEVDQFVHLHKLDRSRFHVIPWGFDLPAIEGPGMTGLPPRYVSVIGRNNRDFATVEEGLKGTGIAGVFVGMEKTAETDDSGNRWFGSLPLNDSLKIMSGALANVILLKDSARGAGHITAVSSMLLGKPQVFSDVGTLTEYLEDGRHGIAVPLRDREAFSRAVQRLMSEPELAKRLGNAAREHALADLSHAKFMEGIVSIILARPIGSLADQRARVEV